MELIRYSINEAEIAKMSDIYMGLTVKSLDDEEGLAAVHSARMVMVKHRVGIDKLRKSSNEEAQAFIKNNNNNAKKLLALIEPIENHLKSEEGKIEAEKARIKEEADRLEKEKIQSRVDALFAVNVILPFMDVAIMTEKDFENLRQRSEGAFFAEKARIAEEIKAREEEEAKLVAERAEIERIRSEQEAIARAQTEREEALKAQEKDIEDAKRAETARKELEALEKRLATEAKIQAEADAKAKIEREAREKKEKDEAEAAEKARQLELAPDKEKLLLFADKIQTLTEGNLSLKSKKAKRVFSDTLKAILGAAEYIRIETKKL